MSLQSVEIKLAHVNDLLRSWGFKVTDVPGAWGRNKGVQNGQGTPAQWNTGEPRGFINHHFVIPLDRPAINGINNVAYGDSTLAGPKCNWYIHEEGIHFIASGPANHAGRGNLRVLERVVAGVPYDSTGEDDYNGNADYLGQEAHHPGDNTPWPISLVHNIIAVNAAVCIVFGWNEYHVINHKWHTKRKIDMSSSFPGNIQTLTRIFIASKQGQEISSIKAPEVQPAQVQVAQPTPPQPTLPPPTPASTLLRRGSTGAGVQELQDRLVERGYLTAALRATGYGTFGPATESSVRVFQSNSGLTSDGVVGDKTWAALRAPIPQASPFPGTVQRGSTGIIVKDIQDRLVERGFMSAATRATGYGTFGPATDGAVRAFQRSKGLVDDGVAGPKTWAALHS